MLKFKKEKKKIPKEIYEKEIEVTEWWKEYDGFIYKEAAKEWKKWNIKEKIIKTLNLSIQLKIAEFIDEIWIERCKKLFEEEMKLVEDIEDKE